MYESVNKIYKKIRELDVSVADLENISHEHPSESVDVTTDATSTTYETTTYEASGDETYSNSRYRRDSGAG